jgi:hypothetical protein
MYNLFQHISLCLLFFRCVITQNFDILFLLYSPCIFYYSLTRDIRDRYERINHLIFSRSSVGDESVICFRQMFHLSFSAQRYYKKCTYANKWVFFCQIEYNSMFCSRKYAAYACIKNKENHFRVVLLFAICSQYSILCTSNI